MTVTYLSKGWFHEPTGLQKTSDFLLYRSIVHHSYNHLSNKLIAMPAEIVQLTMHRRHIFNMILYAPSSARRLHSCWEASFRFRFGVCNDWH